MSAQPPKSSRRFSKRLLVANGIMAWVAVLYSIHTGQGETIAAAGLFLIGTLYGAYTGIGHLDYRKLLDAGKDEPHAG